MGRMTERYGADAKTAGRALARLASYHPDGGGDDDALLRWAATLPDATILGWRNVGTAVLAWIRANQPADATTEGLNDRPTTPAGVEALMLVGTGSIWSCLKSAVNSLEMAIALADPGYPAPAYDEILDELERARDQLQDWADAFEATGWRQIKAHDQREAGR